MNISIPGYKELDIHNLILDYNGTIAVDGSIPQEVKDALPKDLDGRSDEARHGKAFEGLLTRYFGK